LDVSSLPKGLHMTDYCNGVKDFINYALSNIKNINGGGIRCLYKRYKNKKNFNPNVITMHLLQKSSWKKFYISLYVEKYIFLMRP
jgi:hypothetical protein